MFAPSSIQADPQPASHQDTQPQLQTQTLTIAGTHSRTSPSVKIRSSMACKFCFAHVAERWGGIKPHNRTSTMISLGPSLSLYLNLCHCLSVSISIPALPLALSCSLPLCLTQCRCVLDLVLVSVLVFVPLWLSVSVWVSVCLPVCLSLPLSVSLRKERLRGRAGQRPLWRPASSARRSRSLRPAHAHGSTTTSTSALFGAFIILCQPQSHNLYSTPGH